jgi:hypothetical protein
MRYCVPFLVLGVLVGCGGGSPPVGVSDKIGSDSHVEIISDIPVVFNETADEYSGENLPLDTLETLDAVKRETAQELIECSSSQDCESSLCVTTPDGKKYCAPSCYGSLAQKDGNALNYSNQEVMQYSCACPKRLIFADRV